MMAFRLSTVGLSSGFEDEDASELGVLGSETGESEDALGAGEGFAA